MLPVNFHQLQIFISVAEAGGFSRAAHDLSITQPAVSIQIKNLENVLGIRIFERLGKAVHLTPEGRTVLEYAKKLLSLVGSLQSDLENIRDIKTGSLLVGASRVPSTTRVPLTIALFKKQYPDTQITVKVGMSQQVEQWVLENEVDLGIIGGEPTSKFVTKEFCYEEELLVVLPPKHPLAKAKNVSPEALIDEPFLLPYEGKITEFMEAALAEKNIVIQNRVTLGSREAMKAALSVGYGLSIMPKSAVERDVSAGFLVAKKLRGVDLKYPVNLIYHKEKHFSRLVLAFLEFLRKIPIPSIHELIRTSSRPKRQ